MADLHINPAGMEKLTLSVALLGPHPGRRQAVAEALSARPGVKVREFAAFPASSSDLSWSLAREYDAVVVDVDADPEYAIKLLEELQAHGRTYVMAYSEGSDMKAAVRLMRAGVREFFTFPLDMIEIAAALGRAASGQGTTQIPDNKPAGKLLVFLGTKGGCGVTTLASNFALALQQESEQSTLLVDLGLPLGDVAINLGIRTQYSVVNALQDSDRLDSSYLQSIVAHHDSGLAVLGAPAEFSERERTTDPSALDKVLSVACRAYDFVVVDAGSRVDLRGSALFEQSSVIYLITQVGISELRNANRMIAQLFATRNDDLQVVLNRYAQRALLFDDDQIAKTLTRPAQWKIPDDYAAARRTRNVASPMVLAESAIAQQIREMARAVAGISAKDEKKGFFRRR
jgi:pilus assembly protein CpaE